MKRQVLLKEEKQASYLKEKCGIKQYSEYTWGRFKSDFELYSGKINKFCHRKAVKNKQESLQ